MTTNGDVLIRVENLQKAFGDFHALNGITEEIHKGEVVVIIGPSGSGKSTFLRSLNLLEVPTGGHIYFEGVDITDKNNDIFKICFKETLVIPCMEFFYDRMQCLICNIFLIQTNTCCTCHLHMKNGKIPLDILMWIMIQNRIDQIAL